MDAARERARRHVRRKRTFITILVVYLALSLLWFVIDLLTGTDDWWFYWPMLGVGIIVAIIGLAMFGVTGLLGPGWERRQMDRYLERRGGSDETSNGPGSA